LRTESKLDRTWVEVDLAAVRANARTVQARSGARLMPMVKADAYGLGAVPIAKALEELDPWGFGVVAAEEGIALRAGGIVRPVVVVQPTLPMLPACARAGLTPALGSDDEIRAWRALGDLPFHVSVDTGMNRGGIAWDAVTTAIPAFADAPGFEGLMTHFHSAWDDPASVREQWGRFQAVLASLPRRPTLVHAANSVAALGYPEVACDLVRPGIFLYGGRAGRHEPRPVVRWQALTSRAAWVDPGATVSYSARWSAPKRTCVVSVAAGYADGLRRAVEGKGAMLVAGRRWAMAGAVTMDFTMLAMDEPPPAGAVATLIGTDGVESITLDTFAGWADTISYEILTGLGPRVRRVYAG
jgi:alanine racemase